MRNCIANEVESTQNNKQFQLYFDSKACKELYGGGDNSGYNGKPCKEVKRTCPRPRSKLAPDLRTKVSALNLHLLPSESKPTDNYLVL